MSFLDFLFEGKPPPSVTQYGQTVEHLPKWLSDYTQGLISRANAIAAQPYQPYDGPRIAGFNPDQQSAFDMTRQSAGAYQPWLQQSGALTQAAGAMNPLGAAQGHFGDAASLAHGAAGINPLSLAQPMIGQAGSMVQGAAGMPGALSTAAPYLQGAAQTFPGAVDQYMDPYISHVTDRAAQLTGRALNEQLLPGVQSAFGAAGHDPRSTAMRRTVDRGVRDLSEGLQAQNLAALSQGYGMAGQLFGQDASRLGALGQTAGMMQASDIGQQGQLAGILGQLANMQGQLGTQAGQLQLGASGQLGALGQAAGNLTGMQGQLQLGAGQQMGALGQLEQLLGMRGAAGMEAIGSQQQGLQQAGLDLAHQDFLRQQGYPQEMVNWMSDIIRGMPTSRVTETTGTAPGSIFQPSPLAQVGSLATGIGGLMNLFKSRGGRIRRYARGGRVRPRGALRTLRYANG